MVAVQAIEARSVDQEKTNHVNSLTLSFRDSDKERQYQEDPDIGTVQPLSYTTAVHYSPFIHLCVKFICDLNAVDADDFKI